MPTNSKLLKLFALQCLVLLSIAINLPGALAQSYEEDSYYETYDIVETIAPLAVTGDALPWSLFAETTETETCFVDDEGFDYCYFKPGYQENLKELNNTEVTLMGFMFPLDDTAQQQNFLLVPYPLSCPFHLHTGPSNVVEVNAKEAIEFTYEPITLKGTLVLEFNMETNAFYYLNEAAQK